MPGSPDSRSAVTAETRRSRILEQVADSRSMNVAEVAAEFGVSEMTVRRDIRRLEEEGFVRRTYGGAMAPSSRPLELAVNERTLLQTREKRIIGMTMARLLDPSTQSIFLGTGTTTEQFARFIVARDDLAVVTASVSIGALLASRHIRVTLLGGIIRRDDLTLIGPLATQSLDRYRFDLAVVGTSALKVDEGLFDLNDEEAEINRLAVRRAQRLVVLVDSSKIGMVAWAHVAGCSSIHKIVTDENIRPSDAEALRAQGIDVIIATPTTAVSNLSVD